MRSGHAPKAYISLQKRIPGAQRRWGRRVTPRYLRNHAPNVCVCVCVPASVGAGRSWAVRAWEVCSILGRLEITVKMARHEHPLTPRAPTPTLRCFQSPTTSDRGFDAPPSRLQRRSRRCLSSRRERCRKMGDGALARDQHDADTTSRARAAPAAMALCRKSIVGDQKLAPACEPSARRCAACFT